MSSLSHGKKITIDTIYDGKVSATKHEYEKSQFTDKNYLLKEVIESLSVITSGESKKLHLEICIDNKDRYRLVSRWVV